MRPQAGNNGATIRMNFDHSPRFDTMKIFYNKHPLNIGMQD